MLEYILLGTGFGFPAAVQPGPFQAFLFARVAANGWKQTLPAALAPMISDIPVALVVLFALGRLPGAALQALRLAGGLLLIFLAVSTFRSLRQRAGPAPPEPKAAPRTLLEAVLVNLFNPNPYLGWALVLGPAVTKAWHQNPSGAVALIASFYGTMVATLAAFIAVFGTTRWLGAGLQKGLVGLSAVGLAALGAYQIIAVLRAALAP